VELFKKAMELGCANAYCNLGCCYFHGYGVEKDITTANELADKAKKMADDIRSESEDELE